MRARARVEGLDDDGGPLRIAVAYCYTAGAEAVVRCGARVDNVVVAAGLGDLDVVMDFGDEGGPLEPAFIVAAAHGRREVMAFLLERGPDLSVSEPTFGATALGMARHLGHDDIVELLERMDAGPSL